MDLLFFLAIVVMAILGLAAVTVGVDSTEESGDPRRPAYPVGIN